MKFALKFIFTTLFLISSLTFSLTSNLALAQTPDKDVPHTTTSDEKNQDVIGTIASPTAEQKKHIKNAAKKANKKKSTKKVTP